MIFKFNEGEIFHQTVISYPKYSWLYIKNLNDGVFHTLLNCPIYTGIAASIREDSFNKTEINTDRTGSNVIYPFIDKTSGQFYFSELADNSYNQLQFGDRINGTYLDYKTIFRDYITSSENLIFKSLKNIFNSQRKLSEDFNYDNIIPSCSIHIIPQQYYQSSIRKGSVEATIVSLSSSADGNTNIDIRNVIKAKDIYKDGILRIVEENAPSDHVSSNIGTKVGYVLYDYGVVLFKSATVWHYDHNYDVFTRKSYINSPTWSSSGSTPEDSTYYNWKFFGDIYFCEEEENKSFCVLEYEGINKFQHLTMFCTAPSGKLNCSTNPTFIEYSQSLFLTQSSMFSYNENLNLNIKNVISSTYNIEEDFNKQTFLSEIYIYDENKDLIGVGKLANPIEKKEYNAFTVKIEQII